MDQELARIYAKNKEINKKWRAFIEQFSADPLESGRFLGVTFELTAFCTLQCPMCFVRIDKDAAEAMGGRLRTAEEWIDMARQFRDQGGLFLLLTGGEPMMRPDFKEMYEEIYKLGLYITLFTNGTTVDDRMLDLLKKHPPAMMGLTIYGASEETYRKYGGSNGSYQRAVDGLDRLLTIPNLQIDVRFVASSENYKDLRSVYELAAERKKLITVDFGACAPVRGACSDARKLRLSESQLKEVHETVRQIAAPLFDENTETDGNSTERSGSINSDVSATRGLTCKAARNSVYIAWDGRMYPCDMASYPYAFPFEQGFLPAAMDIRRQVDLLIYPERCLTCANMETICSCIPKAQNEMKDSARTGEKCGYTPKAASVSL